jgi:hypothetical protein
MEYIENYGCNIKPAPKSIFNWCFSTQAPVEF